MQLFDEMTRDDIRKIAPRALAILPVGATEQHGPHLPVGTDRFQVEAVARAAAELVPERIPVVVTPTLPFGSSWYHLQFSGTIALSTETYLRVMMDITESLLIDGFQRVFILNGHGGNHEIIQLAARDLVTKYPAHVAAASYWSIALEPILALEQYNPVRIAGHAGVFETALVMAGRPELVREPRPHRDMTGSPRPTGASATYRAEHHSFWTDINGFTDSPDMATAEQGKAYFQAAAESVSRVFTEFYDNCASSQTKES